MSDLVLVPGFLGISASDLVLVPDPPGAESRKLNAMKTPRSFLGAQKNASYMPHIKAVLSWPLATEWILTRDEAEGVAELLEKELGEPG